LKTSTTDIERIRAALDRFGQSSKLLMLIDERGRERLARCATIEQWPASATIVRQGEHGDAFYLIVNGKVRVLVSDDPHSAARVVAELNAGLFFGEMAVLTRQPRSATVEAVTPCELVSFPRDPVTAILNDYPPVREIIGSVSLQRSETNLESRANSQRLASTAAADEPVGLSELLEGADDNPFVDVDVDVDEDEDEDEDEPSNEP
jgi:CRP-like cAMP-binding protein